MKYTIKPYTDAIGIKHKPLDKPNKLEDDAKRMFNSIKEPIKITRSVEFKGEVNTKYPAKAVYANFKRILGEFKNWNSWTRNSGERISESKKQNSFILKLNERLYPLHVEVYPYRDGSKVVYSAKLKYTIDSKGNTTLTKEDIKQLHKKIEDIINN